MVDDDGLECRGNTSQQSNSFLNNLEWRRAVKHFGNKPVDTSPIIRAICNSPSSFGLQPYKVIAVRNVELKKQLYFAAYNQAQIMECDTLFIFCARTNIEDRVEEYLQMTKLEETRNILTGIISYIPDKTAWATHQAYIALGFGLAACAELKIPSCPMEGFNTKEFSRILELSDMLVPCVLLAVGSSTESSNTSMPRFRFPEDNLIKKIDN